MEAHGLDFGEATPAQLVGALREVQQQMAQIETAKSLLWISAALGRKG